MERTEILALGHYVPPRVVSNRDLEPLVGLSASEIERRTGVRERRYASPGTSCSDLASRAVENALANAEIDKGEIDCILYATLSPDHFFPGSGCFLQEKLDLPGIPAFDIRNQCSGFLYGLSVADHFVRLGTYRRVLVVGAEIHSTGLDLSRNGQDLSIIFGDGAGCAIFGPSRGASEILGVRLHADGSYSRVLWVESPSSGRPGQITSDDLERGAQFPRMQGATVFRHAVKRLKEVVGELLSDEYRIDDISLFVFHQANLRIVERVSRDLGIPDERVFNNIDRFGNTTAASIPIALSEAVQAGRLNRGGLVVLASFGSGFTWAGALLRY
jgi:3-oxoacyl-[acyl-carrier-protein] synthase III